MIIIKHNHNNINTSKVKNDADAFYKFRSFYFKLVNNIDLNDITCDCGSHNWSIHSYYKRYYTFMGRRIRVKILRIICNKCGKTHALLIEDMIPYSTLTYNEVLSGMSDDYTIDYSHHLYLINKYKEYVEYTVMCLINKRNKVISFITT